MFEDVKALLAYPAFEGSFRMIFPNLDVYDNDTSRISEYDLIIFSGGEDINPGRYNQRNKFSSFNDERDSVEFSLIGNAFYLQKAGYPINILGVCRGHQLIYASLGGRLVQDISIEKGSRHEGFHALETLIDNDKTIKQFPDGVNSMHHQGIDVSFPIKELQFTASYKGIVEICKGKGILSVQFHPEFMMLEESKNFWLGIEDWTIKAKNKKSPTKTVPPLRTPKSSTPKYWSIPAPTIDFSISSATDLGDVIFVTRQNPPEDVDNENN